jgi:hypothetical protein
MVKTGDVIHLIIMTGGVIYLIVKTGDVIYHIAKTGDALVKMRHPWRGMTPDGYPNVFSGF